VQRLLQLLHFSLAFVVILAATMLASAEEGPIPAISIPLAVLTLITVDRRNWWHVPVQVANTLGIIAFLLVGLEFFRGDLERRVIAGGHLLTYLTCIFLVQKKQSLQIWILLAMSILQVAVASILTNSAWLGPTLLLYVMAALWTLSVFSLYRAGLRVTEHTNTATGLTWTPSETGSRLRHGVRAEQSQWVNSRFIGGGLTSTALSVFLALLFFLFIPRMWISGLSVRADDAEPLTGFAETVSLGDVGTILESTDLVFEAEFARAMRLPNRGGVAPGPSLSAGEAQLVIGGDPLFRGAVLEHYENGRWSLGREREPVSTTRIPFGPLEEFLFEKVRLQPIGTKVLFAVGLPVGAEEQVRVEEGFDANAIEIDRRSFEIHRRIVPQNATMTYLVLCRQGEFSIPTQPATIDAEVAKQFYLQRMIRFPDVLAPLQSFAMETIGGRPRQSLQHSAAQKIQTRLRDSGEFTYSLRQEVRDPKLDPLVDFLVNRKNGHCEYYASAMTMMLRSVGIPARMISGFKGGNFDAKTGLFEVRQLHAHTWVEGYVDDRWRTYDPTPGLRDESVKEKEEQVASSFGSLIDSSRNLWGQSMQMTKDQQQEYLYQPIRERAYHAWSLASGVLSGQISAGELLRNSLPRRDRWFSWQGGLVTVMLGLTVIAGTRAARGVIAWNARRKLREGELTRTRAYVEFFERLLKIFAQSGYHPRAGQTPREFLADVLLDLRRKQPSAGPDLVATRELVEWYYGVRFGDQQLTDSQVEEVTRRLTRLEADLKPVSTPSRG
jgi:hypothetical protein